MKIIELKSKLFRVPTVAIFLACVMFVVSCNTTEDPAPGVDIPPPPSPLTTSVAEFSFSNCPTGPIAVTADENSGIFESTAVNWIEPTVTASPSPAQLEFTVTAGINVPNQTVGAIIDSLGSGSEFAVAAGEGQTAVYTVRYTATAFDPNAGFGGGGDIVRLDGEDACEFDIYITSGLDNVAPSIATCRTSFPPLRTLDIGDDTYLFSDLGALLPELAASDNSGVVTSVELIVFDAEVDSRTGVPMTDVNGRYVAATSQALPSTPVNSLAARLGGLDLGFYVMQVIARDAAGNDNTANNICMVDVTIVRGYDGQAPVIVCPANEVMALNAATAGTATFTWTPPTATDNADGLIVDNAGNPSVDCVYSVGIDNVAPSFGSNCPSDIETPLMGRVVANAIRAAIALTGDTVSVRVVSGTGVMGTADLSFFTSSIK